MQYKPAELTGAITGKYESAFCLSVTKPGMGSSVVYGENIFVDIGDSTRIYKYTGIWPWQKEMAGADVLRTGQNVKVMFDGFMYLTDPYSIDATEIIILREDEPMPPHDGCRRIGT